MYIPSTSRGRKGRGNIKNSLLYLAESREKEGGIKYPPFLTFPRKGKECSKQMYPFSIRYIKECSKQMYPFSIRYIHERAFMTRDKSPSSHQVALLATGDEICNGDIINSNSQEIAQGLFSQGIQVGTHMSVSDNLTDLETAMRFLLQKHNALIITGGLGPTSDDLTRQALSNVLQHPLVFDEPTWQAIVARLDRFGIHTPPESNRQQALFPKDATIIPNPNGTAAGCMAKQTSDDGSQQFIFMLPGPPVECLPLFDNTVLPTLKNNHFQRIRHYDKWLLFNISEAEIAEKLDKIAEPFDCVTGYRFWYPYIECKLYSSNQADFAALLPLVKNAIAPYIIGDGKNTASELLKREIQNLDETLKICDFATGGLLESILKTPQTSARLDFSYDVANLSNELQVTIAGLKEFWQQQENHHTTTLEMCFIKHGKLQTNNTSIPYRGYRVKQYAVEFICNQIYSFLRS